MWYIKGMRGFIQEFKAFAMRGNVMDLAVAVVIGAAFGKIVSSLVENIITPIIGLLMGGVDFSSLSVTVGDATVAYGVFLQSVFDFVIIALAIFIAIKLLSKLQRQKEKEESKPAEPKEEVLLLREIRDNIKK
jgi:large conductance mechanosensitive channel